jgi:hypothetical protein
VQVDPIKPKLKPPGAKRLKLEYDGLVSNFGFKFSLRRYSKVMFAVDEYNALFGGTDMHEEGWCRLTLSNPR